MSEVVRVFDRVPSEDSRNRDYLIRNLLRGSAPRRRVMWECVPRLDQGSEGACVGFGIAHELAAEPKVVPGINAQFAREKIYWAAQRIDTFPGGAYPGAARPMEGTSVLAGAKVAQRLGYIDSYYWGYSTEEVLAGLQRGPVILGVDWLEGMLRPGPTGVITATGNSSGGHCVVCLGYLDVNAKFVLRNSWGPRWGDRGDCYISEPDLNSLLRRRGGEACMFVGRRVNAKSWGRRSWLERLWLRVWPGRWRLGEKEKV